MREFDQKRVLSYCDCSGEEPVEFEKVREEGDYILARCTRCGRLEVFSFRVWHGLLFPEDFLM